MIKHIIKTMSKPVKLIEAMQESSDTYTFKFEIPEGFTWTEGSNVHLLATNFEKGEKMSKKLVRHLSIMTLQSEGYLGFTTRIRENASEFKTLLRNSNVGDTMRIFGLKNHIPLKREYRPIVFISMGVGIATFRPMLFSYLQNKQGIPHITNINVDRSEKYIYKNELQKIVNDRIKSIYVPSRNKLYSNLDKYIDNDSLYYVVGSDEFLDDIKSFLQNKGIDNEQIIFDKH